MKAIIKQDKIVRITERGDTEIGSLPKGVDHGRLRWDGEKIIDLAKMTLIWVRHANIFELHCRDVGGCQLVSMTYSQRKNLTKDPDGTIRVKTPAELQADADAEYNQGLKVALRKRLEQQIGDDCDQLADLYKLVFAVMVYVQTNDTALGTMLSNISAIAKDVYTIEQIENSLLSVAQTLRNEMPTYYMSKI